MSASKPSGASVRAGTDSELLEEAARLLDPGHDQLALRARDADVEEPPLLRDLLVRLRLLRRQLALLEARQEDELELEALGRVVREQVDAAPFGAAVAEALLELGLECGHRRRGERLGEAHEAGQVVLANLLALAEALGRRLLPALGERLRAHLLGHRRAALFEPPQQEAGSLATEERRALERDARFVEHLLEVGEPRVRAAKDRDLLERANRGADPLDDEAGLDLDRHDRPHVGLGPRRQLGAERRREAVRERQHLRRRAVVLLQTDDGGAREAAGKRQQVRGAGAGEAVDRLVVVPDRAQLVAVAEPALEQRLLEEVDVLVLVDGEREIALAEGAPPPQGSS